jgi:hypothetical protein
MAFVLKFLVFGAMIVSYQIIGHWLDAWVLVCGCERNFTPKHFSQTSSGAHTTILGIDARTPFLKIYQPKHEAEQL